MDNMIHDTFDKIHAEDALKQKTADFLHEKIQQPNGKRKTARLRLSVAFASFVTLFIMGGFSYKTYFTPSACVDLDVNPSIELVTNRFGRVIEASPYNDDGAVILEEVSVRHKSYDDAIDTLIDAMISNGYLKQDGLLSVSVQTNDGDRESLMIGNLQSAIDNSLKKHHTSTTTDVFSVNEEVKTHAHENHMSPAIYLAISELQQLDPTTNYEDCRDHTLTEINQMIQEHDGEHHDENQPTDDDYEGNENDNEHGESKRHH